MVGINAKNKNIVDPKFVCSICMLIIRDPIQLTTCGHRLCKSCVDGQHGTNIKCPDCLEATQRNQVLIDRAFKREIESLPIDCSFCQWTGVLINYQSHINCSHPNPKCDSCGKKFESVDELNEHRVLQCQDITVDCILKDFGCDEQIVRCKILDHYLSEQHQSLLLKASHQIQWQMDNDLRSTAVVAVNPSVNRLEELYKTLNNSFDHKEILSYDEQQALNNTLLQCQKKCPTLTVDFLRVTPSVQETSSLLNEVENSEEILNQDLASSRETINDMQNVSYDGTFIWKITNCKEKMLDAQSERQTSIYSPSFYTSPTGYKMRARLYLHGDGNARRTHMSLFFVLMRGLNDPILKFPFNYKVTFCLYDQTGAKQHIIDSFRPDIRSNSFQRPRSDMNIASGIPKFFPLVMIQQEGNAYVRDDTMFIKVMVDFGNIPKTLLPYALSLNPGLPTQVQLTMVRQEAERQVRQDFQNVV